jgi:hypothetical protein
MSRFAVRWRVLGIVGLLSLLVVSVVYGIRAASPTSVVTPTSSASATAATPVGVTGFHVCGTITAYNVSDIPSGGTVVIDAKSYPIASSASNVRSRPLPEITVGAQGCIDGATTSGGALADFTFTPQPSPLPTTLSRPPAGAIVVTAVALGPLHGQIAWVSRMVSRATLTGPMGPVPLATYELWAMPLDGSTPRMAVRYLSAITDGFVVSPGSSQRDTNVLRRQFSPDGRRIVLSVAANANEFDQELRVVNLETGAVAMPVPYNSFPTAVQIDVNPVWSPDGAHIAYVALSSTGASGEVWMMNADGSAATRVWGGCNACLPSSPLIHVASGAPRLYGWLPGSQRIGFDPASPPGSYAVIDLNGVVTAPAALSVTSVDPASWGSASQMFVVGARQAGLPADRSQILQGAGPEQRSLQVIADVTANPNDNNVTGVHDPRWDPQGSATLIYLQSGVLGALVLADLSARTTKLVSSRVAYADWMSLTDIVTLGDIVTLEEHPATAPLSVSVYERDGRLRSSGLFLIPNDTTYILTDLAARAY